MGGLELGTTGPQTSLAIMKGGKFAVEQLYSNSLGTHPESDITSPFFRGSSVGIVLDNNAWCYVARPVAKDMRERLCDVLSTYLPLVVKVGG